jgi:hypothetical protein
VGQYHAGAPKFILAGGNSRHWPPKLIVGSSILPGDTDTLGRYNMNSNLSNGDNGIGGFFSEYPDIDKKKIEEIVERARLDGITDEDIIAYRIEKECNLLEESNDI